MALTSIAGATVKSTGNRGGRKSTKHGGDCDLVLWRSYKASLLDVKVSAGKQIGTVNIVNLEEPDQAPILIPVVGSGITKDGDIRHPEHVRACGALAALHIFLAIKNGGDLKQEIADTVSKASTPAFSAQCERHFANAINAEIEQFNEENGCSLKLTGGSQCQWWNQLSEYLEEEVKVNFTSKSKYLVTPVAHNYSAEEYLKGYLKVPGEVSEASGDTDESDELAKATEAALSIDVSTWK